MTTTITDTPAPTEQERLAGEITHARDQLSTFRAAVRDAIIARHASGAWCRDGINAALGELDLERYYPIFEATATLTVRLRVRNAEDQLIAEYWIEDALAVDSSDTDVEITGFDVNVERVVVSQ